MKDSIYATEDSFNEVLDALNLLYIRLEKLNDMKCSTVLTRNIQYDIKNMRTNFNDQKKLFDDYANKYFKR
jgi:hypothetical protein